MALNVVTNMRSDDDDSERQNENMMMALNAETNE